MPASTSVMQTCINLRRPDAGMLQAEGEGEQRGSLFRNSDNYVLIRMPFF